MKLILRKKVLEKVGEKPKLRLRKTLVLKSEVLEENIEVLKSPTTNREKLNGFTLKPKKPKTVYSESNKVSPCKEVRYMIAYWNEQSKKYKGVPKKVNEMHGGNQTKIFQRTVKSCNAFLHGGLDKIPESNFPNWIKENKKLDNNKTYKDFVIFVDRFVKILHDNNYKPLKKGFVKTNSSLLTFLIGDEFKNITSLLVGYCWNEPKSIVEYKYELFHKCVELMWTKYEPNHKITTNDHLVFDKVLCWLIPWLKAKLSITNEIKTKQFITTLLVQSLEDSWKKTKPSLNYLASEYCRENLEKYLIKLGY